LSQLFEKPEKMGENRKKLNEIVLSLKYIEMVIFGLLWW
jgi:hypothetical protein